MKQSRTMSLVEAIANVAVGYGIAVGTQILVFRAAHDAGAEPEDGGGVHLGEHRPVFRSAAAVRGDPYRVARGSRRT
jgi:hypothetical protein